ncbi:hypothetical protein RF55_10317 [Lasius niger]|uniref:Uncharacterized protein n=1 Tax=Lasius niger TaxID=67767 RepID=A0A0J7KID2_LASNI|nr:hypothetical protein RF55_10317 [Lasius niger]
MAWQIIKAYAYQQYSDDPDIMALFEAHNQTAQDYLKTFLSHCPAIYIDDFWDSGELTYIAWFLWGQRRWYSDYASSIDLEGAIDDLPIDYASAGGSIPTPRQKLLINDDTFRRIMTWNLYRGDGQQFTIPWLKKRIKRWMVGVNGYAPLFGDTNEISVHVSEKNGDLLTITRGCEGTEANGFITGDSASLNDTAARIRGASQYGHLGHFNPTAISQKSISGYAIGALLVDPSGLFFWQNLKDQNTTSPGSDSTWVKVDFQGILKSVQGGGYPIGASLIWNGVDNPSQGIWLEEDGSQYDTSKYPLLYSILKSNHLPNSSGRFIRCSNNKGGNFNPDNTPLNGTQGDAMRNITGSTNGIIYNETQQNQFYGAFYGDRQENEDGTWLLNAGLVGAAGPSGPQGPRGNDITPSDTAPPDPMIGDSWMNDTGEISLWDGKEWVDTTINLTGPQGMQGITGPEGKEGANFTGLGIAFDPPSNPPDGSQVKVILTPQIDGNSQNPVTGTLAAGAKGEKGNTGADGASLSKITLTETPIIPGQSATISLAQFDQNGNPMPSNGAPDKETADLTAAPQGSIYIDETNLPSALTTDEIADRIFNVGQVVFAINQYQAPLAGSWVKWTFGSTLDTKKYPSLAGILPRVNNQIVGLMYGTNNSFPRVANTGGWDSGSDEIRNISGNLWQILQNNYQEGNPPATGPELNGAFIRNSNAILWDTANIIYYGDKNPITGTGTQNILVNDVSLEAGATVPVGAVNTPNFFGVSMWVKADPGSNPMSAQTNRELKTVAGFIYDPQTYEISEFEHPIQEGVSLSKYFTTKNPSLSAAVNEIEIIKEGKWAIVPDLRCTLKNPALSYDTTKRWQTYKIDEPLPENFTLEPVPDFDARYQTILFDGEKWNITTNSQKQAQYKAKDNLTAYYALIPQSIGLRKPPTDAAVAWANGQIKMASSDNDPKAEEVASSFLISSPPRPEGPLSLSNPNWFVPA